MEHYLFRQLAFVRSRLFQAIEGVTEETADRIPEGYRNSIRWQLGHVYVVCERFAFQYIGLPLHMPEGYRELFENGTTMLNVSDSVSLPNLQELKTLLEDQQERMREALNDRMQTPIVPSYTTSGGMTMETPEQFLSFDLYHEGMHTSVIKMYKDMLYRLN
ncbi:DinB family protein [Paenibacillus wynnii]|uniref:DinB family protein n=1 Tax=Paenibacillus wynnii TaxID=268407 RepID=UPI002790308A|nr:DinB family protein [Paenibacillus wynnii]MDQ0193806.1 putative damage-inducible protein DinB [Paenibacillus wynnii]